MAVINHTRNVDIRSALITWTGLATGDTAAPYRADNQQGLAGSIQFTGTFGGATVVLQISNDGTNYTTAKDVTDTAISLTAAGMAEFSTAALYIRPGISGGTGDSITATLVLRG